MTERSVVGYESGDLVPPDKTIAELALALSFPKDFFFAPDAVEPDRNVVSFRALSSMTAGRIGSVLAAGSLAFELSDWLDARFDLPRPQVPTCREAPEAAAQYLRNVWGLGEQPIRNMVHLLESKGIRVFSLAEESKDIDAFSLWRGETPYVFLNTFKSAERGRFDAAHELGHLVLHRHGGPKGREAERDADRFASEFLMPRSSVLAAAPAVLGIERCIRLKRIWQVSVAAMVSRLHQLDLISEWQYRSLFIEMGQRGFRTSEPESIARETSQVLGKVFSALRAEGVGHREIATALRIHADDLNALVFGLVVLELPGGGGIPSLTQPPRRQRLGLV